MFFKTKRKETGPNKVTEGTIKKGSEIFDIIRNTYPKSKRKSVEIRFLLFSDQGVPRFKRLYNVGQKESDNIFAYWENEKAGFLCISYSLPGYDIQAPEDMRYMFRDIPGLSYLDVTNLNVSKTIDFTGCFAKFGENKDSHIFGLEKWNIQNGKYFSLMFYKAFPNNDEVSLIAPSFKTTPLMEASLRECFSNFAPRAEKVILDVIDWNIERDCDLTSCFDSFALQATNVVISGPELWKINSINNFSFMFDNFAPISNCCLDLSRWKTSSKSVHMGFAINTFFKIREPKWE